MGVVEIVCGILIGAGFLTRLAAAALIIDMIVAFASTKVPMLSRNGFWAMAHEARTDVSMLLCSLFLLVVGAGRRSVDARISRAGR